MEADSCADSKDEKRRRCIVPWRHAVGKSHERERDSKIIAMRCKSRQLPWSAREKGARVEEKSWCGEKMMLHGKMCEHSVESARQPRRI